MSFDPTKPEDHSPLVSAEMRAQLNALKAIIDAIAAGAVTGVAIDGVNAVNPGDPAGGSVQLIGGVLRFTFNISRGAAGMNGTNGTTGAPGGPGPQGPQGPPFAGALVGGVTTLNAGDNANVTLAFDGTNVTFFFAIPRGADGMSGISQGTLDTAIAGTSRDTNSVTTLNQGADVVYNQSQFQSVMNKLDELINALRR